MAVLKAMFALVVAVPLLMLFGGFAVLFAFAWWPVWLAMVLISGVLSAILGFVVALPVLILIGAFTALLFVGLSLFWAPIILLAGVLLASSRGCFAANR